MSATTVAQETGSRERTTRGIMLFNRERDRIHRLFGDVWAVPSESQGGFWRVNLSDGTCGCQDFRYQCVDEASEPIIACKHVAAATIARAKDDHPHACLNGYVYLGYTAIDEETGEEVERVEALPCRRCAEEASS